MPLCFLRLKHLSLLPAHWCVREAGSSWKANYHDHKGEANGSWGALLRSVTHSLKAVCRPGRKILISAPAACQRFIKAKNEKRGLKQGVSTGAALADRQELRVRRLRSGWEAL